MHEDLPHIDRQLLVLVVIVGVAGGLIAGGAMLLTSQMHLIASQRMRAPSTAPVS